MRMHPVTLTCLLAGLALLASCSGRGSAVDLPPIPQSGLQAPSDPVGARADHNRYLWSYQLIWVDPSTNEFEVIPLRQAETHWNTLRWLEEGPCTDCVAITNIEPSGTGTWLVDVEITQPFDLTNLTGFDVRGIAMFEGTHEFPDSGQTTSDRTAGEGELVNAEGFTSLYNPGTEGSGPDGLQGYMKGKYATAAYPNSTLNGYMRYISDDPANIRNAFYSGSTIMRTFEIDMPSGPFIFGYAVDASWAPPIHKPVVDPMTDFPPAANCPEPWKVDVAVNPVGQGLNNLGGSAVLTIDVYDWQGKSTVLSPRIECPELFDGSAIAGWKADGTGYTTYEATISNAKFAAAGEYKCLVAAEDTENDPAPAWLNLTAYQILPLTVVEFQDNEPVAQATADPNPQTVCEDVNFDDDGSYDPDGGSITKYEWDWDNDGTFDQEGKNVTHSWTTPGTYPVQFRVTDDDTSTDTLDTPIQVVINNALPTASAEADNNAVDVGVDIHFDATASTDNDCGGDSIVNWQWDWENGGTWDATGETQVHFYDTEGTYEVQLRVTDNEGGTDVLDSPITVKVSDSWVDTWTRTWGGSGDDFWTIVAIDTSGNAYVTGYFADTVDFDPGSGVDNHTSNGSYDGFLCKFDSTGNFLWARTWGGIGEDYTQSVAIDTSGNPYVAGSFKDTVDFDPGSGVDDHTSNGYWDAFLCKFDSAGTFIWARTWGGTLHDGAAPVAIDTSGNPYVGGSFTDTVDFDPGSGVDNHTSNGYWDASLCKFDSEGNFLWARSWGGSEWDFAYSVATDLSDDIYTVGCFQNTVDFDPGGGVDNHTSIGANDAFLNKFDSSGDLLWARTWGGTGSDTAWFVATGDSENAYVAGTFCDTVDFDPGSGVDDRCSNGDTDAFLSKFDSNGDIVWVSNWGGIGSDYAQSVAIDGSENVYVAGGFSDTVDFDPGSGVDNHTSNGSWDAFLCKFDSEGNFLWARSWGGAGDDSALSVAIDELDSVYVAGGFSDTVDFDPGSGVDNHTSNGSYDIFLSKFAP